MRTELAHLVNSFHCDTRCGNPEHFDSYIRYNAISDTKTGIGVTHVALGFDDNGNAVKIQGFITLKANSVVSEYEGISDGKPALEISELAVDKEVARHGLGTMLVKYALALFDDIRQNIGVRYAVVCADENAVEFYKKVGFSPLSDLYEIPREQWNIGCVPMYIDLARNNEPYYGDEDKDE